MRMRGKRDSLKKRSFFFSIVVAVRNAHLCKLLLPLCCAVFELQSNVVVFDVSMYVCLDE